MTSIQIRQHIYEEMTKYLETMCAYHATGDQDLFRYYAGKADACKELLQELFCFIEEGADEHVKAMWDIMDNNW